MPPSPYPTAYQIEEMFANRGNPELFNTYLAEPVDVLVMGGEDFHLGGRYSTVQAFHDEIYGHVTSALKVETFKVEVLRVIGGGESPWAAVESLSTATSKYGEFGCSVCVIWFGFPFLVMKDDEWHFAVYFRQRNIYAEEVLTSRRDFFPV